MIEFIYTNLYWREPLWLLLLFQPVVVILLQRHKRQNQVSLYADEKLRAWVVSPNKKRLSRSILQRKYFFLIAWILFSIAMAGPRMAQEISGDTIRSGLDVMVVVDLSRSMRATDVQPSRIQRSQIELHELIRKFSTEQQRLGLVVYAARPHLYFPLTADRELITFYLNLLDGIIMPTHGSNIVDAIQMSLNELANASTTSGAILLLTDGDFDLSDNKQKQLDELLVELKAKKIPLYILGVGSVEGEAIPLANGSWLMDKGNAVVSHMDEDRLRDMADQTNGRFSMISDDARDWDALYINGMRLLQSSEIEGNTKSNVIWKEYYPWFLFPGVILLFITSLPFHLDLKLVNNQLSKLLILFCLVFILVPVTKPVNANEISDLREAGVLFKSGQYLQARDIYKVINGFEARFGEGASRYRLGDHTGAIRQFSQAALETSEEQQRSKALYNLANSYYQTGNYQTAVEVYNDVLRYQPGNQSSINNRDVSLILIQQIDERLELERAARAGSGPRSAAAAEGVNLNESSRVSVGDDESNKSDKVLLPVLPGISNEALEELIQKGIKHTKVAASGTTEGKQSVWQQQLFEARFLMQTLQDDRSKHMQRLFEMEEGFAAPVEKPMNVPGMQPW